MADAATGLRHPGGVPYPDKLLTEDEKQDGEKVSVVQKLYPMNTAEKVIVALKGSSGERAVLVRDPNRIVASAVNGRGFNITRMCRYLGHTSQHGNTGCHFL